MEQIQFSLVKNLKIGRPGHSLPPTPLRPMISHFCPIAHPPESGRRVCIPPLLIRLNSLNIRNKILR